MVNPAWRGHTHQATGLPVVSNIISSKLEETIYRREDFILRIGGDEFVVICSTNEPEKMHERIKTELTEKNISFYCDEAKITLSASVGLAYKEVINSKISPEEEIALYEELSKEADKMMYDHKKGW